ncbi:MAG: aquaporin [Anaerolineae bacterium]|nr:aquaporin [Anaerolineae bacterium]
MDSAGKAYVAELLGTFMLVFIGGLSVIVAGTMGVVVPAFGHGLILLVIAFALGNISGAHVNPAITISLLLGNKISVNKAVIYIVMQVLGAVIAALLIMAVLPDVADAASGRAGQAIGSLTASNLTGAGILEFVFTFLLATTVWQTAAHGRAGNLAPIAIGLTLAACILAGGIFSGASLNPARTLGPALIGGDMSYVPLYVIAQILGGVLAWFVNGMLLTPDK